MAGYVISVGKNSEDELYNMMANGIYGTILNVKKTWSSQNEGTIADFVSMKPGDHIYFFRKRKIYGICELVAVGDHDCKLLNYIDADNPSNKCTNEKEMVLNNSSIRFICTFKPKPFIFKKGLDMDYVLQSNPDAFKMLRAFWKLSFIKVDDVEDKALFDILLRENEASLSNNTSIIQQNTSLHNKIREFNVEDLNISIKKLIAEARKDNVFKREMSLELAIIELLSSSITLGSWDYISHQVIASPLKPIDYMDKMDVFGYKYIEGFKTISKYLVIELKKDSVGTDDIDQTLKYVDWINQEYVNGDFEMIEAYIIANTFKDDIINYCKNNAVRNFTKNKPAENKEWRNLKLYEYFINEENLLELKPIIMY